MGKLQDLIQKSLKADVTAVVANAPVTVAPKSNVAFKGAGLTAEQDRVAEVAFITKTLRKGAMTAADMAAFDVKLKAVGVTGDIAELLPTGFTGALWHDIQERLVVTSLFPYKETTPGQYDSIAVHGIQGYLTGENVTATESSEDYITMIYLVAKCMAAVKKSYEVLDDSLIDLATEVRNGIVDALARSIEDAIINGDNSTPHFDDAAVSGTFVGVKSYKRAFKGLRKIGLGKNPVDFGGAAMVEADWLTKITEMQEAGGVYLDDQESARGNTILLVDQNAYNKLRMLPSFLTKDKAGLGTLFGMPVSSVFDMPVLMTPYLPIVDANGVFDDTTPANNVTGTCVMVNKSTMKYYTTGSPLMETDKDIYTQFIGFTGSVRTGFNSIFDRLDTDPNAIDATRNNIVVGINIAR